MERIGLTTFARRNKACFFFLLYVLKLRLSPDIPTQHSETGIIPLKSTEMWRSRKHRFCVLKFPLALSTSHVVVPMKLKESHYACKCDVSRMWMSHVMDESRHTYECVVLHVWMSQVSRINVSHNIYEWVVAHVWMSTSLDLTLMNKSCHTHIWSTSHTKESCRAYECVKARI